MQSLTNATFGPLIAYLVPGATALWGLSRFSPALRALFETVPADAPTLSGFLYLSVAAVATGMTVTALRWALVDVAHALTGLPSPHLDFSQLPGRVDAYLFLIDIHYRHYQFYANMAVALAIAYVCHRITTGLFAGPVSIDLGFLVLETVFLATSRDTLRKYYQRTEQLLSGGEGERHHRSERASDYRPSSRSKRSTKRASVQPK
ncbi:MAG: hypothetical protein ACK5Q5_19270 [Planctomycetaceae bacterium]